MEHTLHEFMLMTKAGEFLISVLFLALFTGFWAFLFGGYGGKHHE